MISNRWQGFCIAMLLEGLLVGCNVFNKATFSARNGFRYASYQETIACHTSHFPREPESLSDIQAIVDYAGRTNLTVKPVGSLHSQSDMICTDGIPISLGKIKHFRYDPVTQIVTIGGGVKIDELTEQLHQLGRAVEGKPLFAGITVAGSIATGAHGSSLVRPTSLSDQMVDLVVVDGRGNVRNITEAKDINAFRTHLGLLGVVYEVRLRTVPQYKLQVTSELYPDSILDDAEKILQIARSHPYVFVWWFPSSKEVIIARGDQVSTTVPGDCRVKQFPEMPKMRSSFVKKLINRLQDTRNQVGLFYLQSYSIASIFRPLIGKAPLYLREDMQHCPYPAVGFSHRMTSQTCKNCLWDQGEDSLDLEFAETVIPSEELGSALKTINGILSAHPTEFPLNGIFFRFLTSSEGILAPNRGRESVDIEWNMVLRRDKFSKPKVGLAQKQAMIQALVTKHRGRTHWAKVGLAFSLPEMNQLQHPEGIPEFVKYMEEMDPQGVFLNDFGRRIRYQETKMSLDRERSTYCALGDHCFCSKNEDCGPLGGEVKCGTLDGYNVCLETGPKMEMERIRNERNVVKNFLQPLVAPLVTRFSKGQINSLGISNML